MALRKTHCVRGHAFTPENTYVAPNTGNRGCRTCRQNERIRRKAETQASDLPKNPCLVDGCEKPEKAKRLCRTHYERQRKGEVDWDRPIRKRRDGWTQVERLMDQRRLELVVPELGECWRFTGSHNQGYGSIVDDRRSDGATTRTHIVAYREWVGEIPEGQLVRHRCDVRDCFRPDHLILGTIAENNEDARERGRIPLGEKKWSAKLTDVKAREIRADTRPVGDIAKEYGVSSTTVSLIKSGKKWTHITDK